MNEPNKRFLISDILSPPNSTLRFVITDCPDNSSLPHYVNAINFANPKYIFRICDKSSYDTSYLQSKNIIVNDYIKFEDGSVPSTQQVTLWLTFLENVLLKSHELSQAPPCIIVHCVSGIGRAPLLVALAFIECNVDPMDAIETIRFYRRGALNSVQIKWLCEYKGKNRLCLANILKRRARPQTSSKSKREKKA